jgi:hypothetical protein
VLYHHEDLLINEIKITIKTSFDNWGAVRLVEIDSTYYICTFTPRTMSMSVVWQSLPIQTTTWTANRNLVLQTTYNAAKY